MVTTAFILSQFNPVCCFFFFFCFKWNAVILPSSGDVLRSISNHPWISTSCFQPGDHVVSWELLPSCPVPLHGHSNSAPGAFACPKDTSNGCYKLFLVSPPQDNFLDCKKIFLEHIKMDAAFRMNESKGKRMTLEDKCENTQWLYQTLTEFFSSFTARVIALREKMFSTWCQNLTAW